MRVVITGGAGQLAHDLVHACAGWEVLALDRSQLDITDGRKIGAVLDEAKPDVLINTAAFNAVDRCESDPEPGFLVNTVGPQRLAAACEARGILLVHYSTDYVFDGAKSKPYSETDPVRPLNVYGVSKAAGEMAVRTQTDRHVIIRTTGLFGRRGRDTGRTNFVETMLRLAATGETISVVADQVLTPTSTADLAATTRQLILTGARGTYHITNTGACSWYEFAAEIFRQARLPVDLRPVAQRERPVPARRPAYSVLGHEGILGLGLPDLPPWQEALSAYMRDRLATH